VRSERAQALVEAALVLPACVACAVTIVDAGVLVRDRMATTEAATRAAEARIDGTDVRDAARSALPESLRDRLVVREQGDRIEVRTSSDLALSRLAGTRIGHRSSVTLLEPEAVR
jgi:hypothetical protein